MKLKAFAFKPLQDRQGRMQRVRLEDVYSAVKRTYQSIRSVVNANENPVLIAEASADNAATLDVGDNNGASLWNTYSFLLCRLHAVRPATDGDYLCLRYGGGGSWWTSGDYAFTSRVFGQTVGSQTAISQTLIQCWPDDAAFNQGNVSTSEELYGRVEIALATGSAAQGSRSSDGYLTWAATSGSPRMCRFHGRYSTTAHLTALRFFYGGGNIYGTASLWGWRKS